MKIYINTPWPLTSHTEVQNTFGFFWLHIKGVGVFPQQKSKYKQQQLLIKKSKTQFPDWIIIIKNLQLRFPFVLFQQKLLNQNKSSTWDSQAGYSIKTGTKHSDNPTTH